jgi:hypothetical protein
MKKSSIIFISLLGAVAILIIIVSLDLAINGKNANKTIASSQKINYSNARQNLPSFKVLLLKNCKGLSLARGDSSYYEIRFLKDSLVPNINFVIHKDTLIISDLKLTNIAFFTLYATPALKKFHLKNSDKITVRSFIRGNSMDKLTFNLDNSDLSMLQEKEKRSSLTSIDIIEKNDSHINGSSFQVDSVNILLQNSQADLSIDINKLRAGLSEESKISVRQPKEIFLKRDASSNIKVY